MIWCGSVVERLLLGENWFGGYGSCNELIVGLDGDM